MKKPASEITVLETVTEYTRFFGLPAPSHPLLTIIDFATCRQLPVRYTPVLQQFYTVSIKRNLKGPLYYGYQKYDFSEGVMVFLAPGQVFTASAELDTSQMTGWMLLFHPDLLTRYPLAKKILSYGFFSYDLHEALHLSAKEETVLAGIVEGIVNEYNQPIDAFSQDVLVSQLDVLLNYANRFYHRQFQTRRVGSHDLLSRFEALVRDYFAQDGPQPLPSVQYFADALGVSAAYLGDMLRTLTGQNTQQHIHYSLIEKAKRLLLTTSLSVNETAYALGFEYPQYFSRLFKNKTGVTPMVFRAELQQP